MNDMMMLPYRFTSSYLYSWNLKCLPSYLGRLKFGTASDLGHLTPSVEQLEIFHRVFQKNEIDSVLTP